VSGISDSRASKSLYYAWTPAGRLAKLNDSDGHTFSFGYDATGRLVSLTAPNNESMSMAYDAGGRLTARRSASGLLTQQSWYADGSLQAKSFSQGASVLTNHTYALDAQGRRSGVQEVINGVTRNWSYGYDGLDRLSSATVDGSAETYGYDIFGNRTSKANSTNTLAYIFDAAHQLSQIRTGSTAGPLAGAAAHDASGRMIKLCEGASITTAANDCTASGANASTLSMAYNALDQLLSANRTGTNPANETYAYDDQGRRISKTSGGVQTNNLYNGDAIHSQWVTSPSNTPIAVMVHGAGIDEPLMRLSGTTNTPNATARFYMTDGLGSVIGQVDENGANAQSQRFDAWGGATNATNPSGINTTPPYGFTGREPDGTGLIHYRARNYLPRLGIFTSRDPAGMVDAVSPYAYVGNRPTLSVDPMGWLASDPVLMVADASGGSYFGRMQQTMTDAGRQAYNMLPSKQTVTNFLDNAQKVLDVAGLAAQGPLEVVAPIIDLASAGVSVARGDYTGAALSGLGAVPFVGSVFNAAKVGRGIDNAGDLTSVGRYAGDSIPARSQARDFTTAERSDINSIGSTTGCHSCGTTNPGTKTDNFVPDHQPPSSLNVAGEPQRLYPQCLTCSRNQGLEIARRVRGGQ
jgi:RHS repeat-associated protein